MHSIINIFVEINMTKTAEFENELVSCDTFVVMPDVSATGEVRSSSRYQSSNIKISNNETMNNKGHFREELR